MLLAYVTVYDTLCKIIFDTFNIHLRTRGAEAVEVHRKDGGEKKDVQVENSTKQATSTGNSNAPGTSTEKHTAMGRSTNIVFKLY